MAVGLWGVRRHARDAFMVADIEFQRNRTVAESHDFFFECQQVITVSAGEHQIGASFGEGACEVLTETTAGSGDNRHLAVKIKESLAHDAVPGARTTFINFPSPPYTPSNHSGPP